jgi:hypothetical protein
VTAFKDGFQKGLFATLPPWTRAERSFRRRSWRATRPTPSRAFDLRTEPARMDDRTGTSTIEVINLDPGLLYSFRLVDISGSAPKPIATVTVEAPVCVADMKEGR